MNNLTTPGFRFKDGKLYIFTSSEIMLLCTLLKLRAVRKQTESLSWRPFSPSFRVVAPYRRKSSKRRDYQMTFDFGSRDIKKSTSTARKRAFDSFRFSMPKDVTDSVEKFQSMQWKPLKLLEAEPFAIDACQNNTALIY